MPTATPKPKPMPTPDVPVLKPDGRMHEDWYQWLKQFYDLFRGVREEIP